MRTTVILSAALSCLALAACGGSDDPSAAGGGGGSSTTSSDADREAARVKLAECMREHGVDVPDPGSGPTRMRVTPANREKVEEAMQACEKYREAAMPDLSDEERQEIQDAFERFRDCMRRHGQPVPNIQIAGVGGSRGADGPPPEGAGRIDPDDPDFKAAEEECSKELPERMGRRAP